MSERYKLGVSYNHFDRWERQYIKTQNGGLTYAGWKESGFLKILLMEDNCIIWNGRKWAQGRYGMDTINGKSMGAHRAAWIRINGAITKGLVVCHLCDNGLCININHLFLGTPKDNMQDCLKKGRYAYINQQGKNNRNARKDYEEILKKSKEMRANGFTYTQIKEVLKIKSNGHLKQLLNS